MISGGAPEIASGGSANGTTTFVSSGTLKLDSSITFGGTISGFGMPDYIDMVDVAFGSNTTLSFTEAPSNTSGILTVSDGVHTANVMLLGQYVTAQFTSASDGAGGILIGDPPISGASNMAGSASVTSGGTVSSGTTVTPGRQEPANTSAGMGLLGYRNPWAGGEPDTLGFPAATGHAGAGAVDAGHVAQIALLNQFVTAHFKSASGDNGGAALTGVISDTNPVAMMAHHHP